MKNSYEGGCLCGAVRYLARDQPIRTIACHCRFCQRVTGSALNVEAIFRKASVTFTRGEPRMFAHRSEGSGKMVYVHFCGECGTNVSLTFDRFPDARAIMRGTLDDPNGVRVDAHIFTRTAQVGMVLPANVDCFDEHRLDLEGSPRVPATYDRPREVGASRRSAPGR